MAAAAAAEEGAEEAAAEEEEEEEEEEEYSRGVGGTEDCWCKAVSGGTGVTVVAAAWQADKVDVAAMEAALRRIQAAHPRLRSRLRWAPPPLRPFFSVAPSPFLRLHLIPPSSSEFPWPSPSPSSSESSSSEFPSPSPPWLPLVESHLQPPSQWLIPPASASASASPSSPLFLASLFHPLPPHLSPETSPVSLLILRLHSSICDRSSASSIVSHLLRFFSSPPPTPAVGREEDHQEIVEEEQVMDFGLSSIEDAVAPHLASKPFWAHGLDILGYSLGSRRHATLPFQDVQTPRRSLIILANLAVDATQKLIHECAMRKITIAAALTAASMKAIAKAKQLGSRGEHHAVITMVDCRRLLEPPMSKSTIGHYQSAIMNTYYIEGEAMDFWDFAKKCSTTLERAITNRKHFTDMGDLGLLMCQAIQMPHLTPFSSLRTSTLVVFNNDELYLSTNKGRDEQLDSYCDNLGFLGYTGCSSIHGVGPSIAIFDDLCQGSLRLTCVFPSPLHSRDQMQELVENIISFLNLES